MKKLLAMMALTGIQLFGVTVSDELLDSISIVESNRNDNAVGDNGNALGRYQMWNCVVQDANEVLGTSYTHEDAKDAEKARKMAVAYLKRYGRSYERSTGKIATDEVLARIWNGGPKGYKKQATVKYWNKVKKELEK